ncbi:MAG: hypothetical protein ACJAZO_001466 [Myxococcota bacterium]
MHGDRWDASGAKGRHLVVHKCDERADNKRCAAPFGVRPNSWELKAHRLAVASRKSDQYVSTSFKRHNRLALGVVKARKVEPVLQGCVK